MATATQFFQYWALAFASLGLALWLLSLFYRIIGSDLGLHSVRKELVIAVAASAVQGVGFWASASLFHGDPFRRLLIPGLIMGIIYWFAHLEDWNGYEFGGIVFFQAAILVTGLCLVSGQIEVGLLILGVFVVSLVFIASIAKSL